MKTETEMKPCPKPEWQSCALWAPGVVCEVDNTTRDNHYTEGEAQGVCRLLERNGFGGDKKVYPVRTWVERTPSPPESKPDAGTPRTDARVAAMTGELRADEFIPAGFARTLENELTASQAELARVKEERDAMRKLWGEVSHAAVGTAKECPDSENRVICAIHNAVASAQKWIAAQHTLAENEALRRALKTIVECEPKPIDDPFPADWEEQIKACSECQGWAKNHPIQNGICDLHRKPIWERERREKAARSFLPHDMRDIARAALTPESPKGKGES